MQQTKTKQLVMRWIIYLAGLLILALGLTLNTKTGLGASAVTSIAHTISLGTGIFFGNVTLITYLIFIAAQFVIKGKNRTWLDLLQLVVSVIFTRVLDFRCRHVGGYGSHPEPGRRHRSRAVDAHRQGAGVCKSYFDIVNMSTSLICGFFFGNPLLGIGVGTIASMLGIGRCISLFNKLFRHKLRAAAGLEEPVTAA